MSRPTGTAVLLAAALVAGSVVTAVARADEASRAPTPVAAPVAAASGAAPSDAQALRSAGAGATAVTFDVPARTYVRIDDSGAPVAAMTNTQCPPSATDEVVVVDVAGDVVAGVDLRPAGQPWSGDWTRAGAWHAWPSA